MGINKSEQVAIFEAFTQANSSINRTHGGTGLGLQIVKSFVEAMGGNVSLNSEVGKGSTFSFEIAFRLAKKSGDSVTRTTTEPATETPTEFSHNTQSTDQEMNALGMNRGSVLVVDDNEINQVVAQSLLEYLRVGVTLASSGEEALILVPQEAFDLILMDLQMPQMTGAEITLELRHKGVNPPVVAFTASLMSDEIDKAMSSGMSSYITKPVDIGKRTTVIDRYLPR